MPESPALSDPLLRAHWEHLEASPSYSPQTVERAVFWLRNFEQFCGRRCPLSLETKDLEDWRKQLSWSPGPSGKMYSPNTVNQAVGAVRRFYRFLLAEGKLETNPTRTLVTAKQEPASLQRAFTAEEKRRLLSSPSKETATGIRDRAVLGVLLETGVSRGACSRLELGSLCLQTGALLTRGRRQRIHSLSFGLLADLERYLRESRPLLISGFTEAFFLNKRGARLSQESVHQVLLRHRRLCGL